MSCSNDHFQFQIEKHVHPMSLLFRWYHDLVDILFVSNTCNPMELKNTYFPKKLTTMAGPVTGPNKNWKVSKFVSSPISKAYHLFRVPGTNASNLHIQHPAAPSYIARNSLTQDFCRSPWRFVKKDERVQSHEWLRNASALRSSAVYDVRLLVMHNYTLLCCMSKCYLPAGAKTTQLFSLYHLWS